jgi:N-acetyltransferase
VASAAREGVEPAFEGLGCMRVEFKTDARNERSRAALEALPARFEGIFRRHMIIEDVGVRDSAFYSVTDEYQWRRSPRAACTS